MVSHYMSQRLKVFWMVPLQPEGPQSERDMGHPLTRSQLKSKKCRPTETPGNPAGMVLGDTLWAAGRHCSFSAKQNQAEGLVCHLLSESF